MDKTILKLKRGALISILLSSWIALADVETQKEHHKKEAAPKTAQESSKAAAPKKTPTKTPSKTLEPWEAWDKYREQMITISRQLGVTCTHCHDSKNYRESSKPTHKIAKSHMELVDMINEKYKNSFSDKVDCYMCHKGVAKPEFKEKKEGF